MSTSDRFKLRTILASSGLTVAALAALLLLVVASDGSAQACTSYAVTSSTPPANANWTATSGLWTPSGSYPGENSACDTATDNSPFPTTIVVNSPIPNPIAGLDLSCNGCIIDIQAGGSLTLSGGGYIGNGATLKMSGGDLAIASGGSLIFQSGSQLLMTAGIIDVQTGGLLTLNVDATVGGASQLQVNGGTLTIPAPAVLTVQTNLQLNLDGKIDGGGTIENYANFEVAGTGVATVDAVFNNHAGTTLARVWFGTVSLRGGGTGDGPFTIDAGATLDFPSNTYTMNTGGVVSGGGTLSITGGTLNIGGVTSPAGFTLTAGVLDGPGFLSIGKTFHWDGGTITGSGGTELAGTGMGNLSGVSGAMTLTDRIFNNYGTITYTSDPTLGNGELTLTGTAAFNTYGTFDIQGDASISGGPNTLVGVFPNGVIEKSSGNGTSSLGSRTQNDSVINAQTGTLAIGEGTHKGLFVPDSGATILFGDATLLSEAEVFGYGNVKFGGGGNAVVDAYYDIWGQTTISLATVTFNSTAYTNDFLFDAAGFLNLMADFVMTGSGTWSAGTMQYDDGFFIVDTNATLTIDSANGVTTLDSAIIENLGTINYTAGGSVFLGGGKRRASKALISSSSYLDLRNFSTISNDGLFDIQGDAQIASNFDVFAEGSRQAASKKTPGASVSLPPVTTASGYVVTHRARIAGVHAEKCICASSNVIENFDTMKKTGSGGTTDVGPDFGNSGYVKAENGTLHFLAEYTQIAGATTLGPGSISVAGTFELDGGILDGSGNLSGNLDNYGEVKPGTPTTTGVINIAGNYESGTSSSSSIVTIKIAGPSAGQFDQVNITGDATLDGTFNGSFIGGYVPPSGSTTWSVITYPTETGVFSTVNPPTYSGGTVTHAYNPTSFDLTAVTPASADVKILNSGPASANAGATLTYTVNVSNLGPDATSGTITVTDSSTGGATPVGGSAASGWNCGIVSGSINCITTSTTLASGASLPTLTFTWTAPPTTATVINTATVFPNSVADPVSSNNSASVTTNVGPQANLSITKTVTNPTPPNPVNPGQDIEYSIVVQNNGPSTASAPVVTDNTPVGIAFVSASGGGCTAFPCNLPALASGQSVTINSKYSVPTSYSGGPIVNTASVSSPAENDPNLADNSSTTSTSVGAAADVGINKSGPATTNLGANITYTITVSNSGPAGANGVIVSDATPPGLTPVSVSGGGCTSFPCNIGALAVGPPVTITATYNVPPTYSGPSPILNTATVSSASDPNTSNNSSTASTTVAAQADLGVTKSGPPSALVGSTVSYTITVTNSGAAAAANTFVADPTPPGITPAGVSGGGCSSFPCALGTVASGQTIVITASYNVPANYAGTSISNTASVSTSSPESNTSNNSSTAVTPISSTGVADLNVTKSGPPTAPSAGFVDFTIVVFNNGPNVANNVVISDPTPAGLQYVSSNGACSTPFPCVVASLDPNKLVSVTGHYRVIAPSGSITNTGSASSSASDPVPANNSSSATVTITPANTCPQAPILTSPPFNAIVTSPVTFSWSPVPNATGYILSITTGGSTQTIPTTTVTSLTQTLGNGAYTWSVQAIGNGCAPASAIPSPFTVCNTPGAPIASVVGATTSGQTYTLEWTPIEGATLYEVEESADLAFPTSTTTGGTSMTFTKNVQGPITYFYRVRAVAGCFQAGGPFSTVAPVVIVPLPPIGTINVNIPVPSGSKQPVTFPMHIDGLPGVTTSFFATVDKPWLAVTPTNGIMPPEGINFTISADPSTLLDGTWTGTVIIVFGSSGVSGKTALDVAPKTSIPVSISLTTPVTPATLTGPSATAVIIPSVGHLAGFSSQWQSDIRIANITALSKKVMLTFNAGSATSQSVKQTTISIDPGATTALDDIVRNWFGTGAKGDSTNGVLTVQPLDLAGKPDLSVTKSTVASSRTFNASALGTLGQFIPAVPLASFISKAPGSASVLALQQIAQTDTFHTNLGLVEATGKSASVLVSVFNGGGSKVLEIPVSLNAGEQKQLNSFMADKGVTLTNGHIEVQATGGDGKVTAYASVIDSRTSDPLLVSGVPIGGVGASRFVLPGVASLDSGASWRSDVRIFNSSALPQTATMTLYPTANPSAAVVRDVSIQPGEVKALDDIVHSTFNLTNAGGALHVTTAVSTPLVVTARTFNNTAAGTLGQFLQAVTPADSVGNGERSLQLLQMEDSPRYRTNLGLAEVTGKAATAEVTVILPDSKVAPKVSIPLAAFEYRQFSIISSLGLGNTYNARISVRVIDGQGKVTAYGSVIDQKTQDPTFVPAQ